MSVLNETITRKHELPVEPAMLPALSKDMRRNLLSLSNDTVVTEKQILAIKKAMTWNKVMADAVYRIMMSRFEPIRIEQTQFEKGLKWLRERRLRIGFNSQQRNVIENADHFDLDGFMDAFNGNSVVAKYVPIYRLWDGRGNSFAYTADASNRRCPIRLMA